MNKDIRWIWEEKDYPNFTFDNNVINPLIQKTAILQGYLKAFTSFLDNDSLENRQFDVLLDEAMSTSAIEGENLKRDSVRSSVGRKLGLDKFNGSKIDSKTDGLIDILIDANTNYNKDLEIDRIFGWHNAMFPRGFSGFNRINVAQYRSDGDMEVVSGVIGKEIVRYVAPKREILEDEMKAFLEWFNSEDETLIKAAIAHLWFVVIHPLDDGNGRISRAISDLVLSKIESSSISRLYSMSAAIYNDRKGYYHALDLTTGFKRKNKSLLDITYWLEWFLNTLILSLEDAKKSLQYVLDKTSFWDKHKDDELNPRQVKVLNKILDKGIENYEGGLNKRKYIAISKTSSATASRDILELIEKKCIKQIEGSTGRGTGYIIIL